MSFQSAIDIFRYVTVGVTLALVAFCMWITKSAMVGRILAGGVLLFGVVQFLVLTRMSRKASANAAQTGSDADDLERDPYSG